MNGFSCDCVVIGAGVVGLAVARALALYGREVIVLEACDGIGMGTSSRNSEVIHAGLYYPKGSLKARLCVEGRQQLYAYARSRGVSHRAVGKLVVATDDSQTGRLTALLAAAQANGVTDARLISAAEAMALEPALSCTGALLSPSTGIIDSHGLMLALEGDLEAAGGMIAFRTTVLGGSVNRGLRLDTSDGPLTARLIVNCAGHGAPPLLSRLSGFPPARVPQQWFAKGHYFALGGRQPFQRLIYPLPAEAGLGIHATLDLDGRVRFGPDVEWVRDDGDFSVDAGRIPAFETAIRLYWPALPPGALSPAYSGIRPKIHSETEPAADFRIDGPCAHGIEGLIALSGIESPGLTAALAIGDYVAALARG